MCDYTKRNNHLQVCEDFDNYECTTYPLRIEPHKHIHTNNTTTLYDCHSAYYFQDMVYKRDASWSERKFILQKRSEMNRLLYLHLRHVWRSSNKFYFFLKLFSKLQTNVSVLFGCRYSISTKIWLSSINGQRRGWCDTNWYGNTQRWCSWGKISTTWTSRGRNVAVVLFPRRPTFVTSWHERMDLWNKNSGFVE